MHQIAVFDSRMAALRNWNLMIVMDRIGVQPRVTICAARATLQRSRKEDRRFSVRAKAHLSFFLDL